MGRVPPISKMPLFANIGFSLILAATWLSSCAEQRRAVTPNLPRFVTLPPGSTLPSEADCAARVRSSAWEPQPDNYLANHRVPTAQQIARLAPWGPTPQSDSIRKQITGNFTGTTDEILQWASCKWGIDTDILRAEAIEESGWLQSARGDWTTDKGLCPPGAWEGNGCYQSYGILQIKYFYNQTAWPMIRDDTAFNVEYAYGHIRNCFEGRVTYLKEFPPVKGYSAYHAGDIWGCLGVWYSGRWYDQHAIKYINEARTILAKKLWLTGPPIPHQLPIHLGNPLSGK
jgi:hypothetical protein